MKKYLLIFGLVLLAMLLFGCIKETEPVLNQTTNESSTETNESVVFFFPKTVPSVYEEGFGVVYTAKCIEAGRKEYYVESICGREGYNATCVIRGAGYASMNGTKGPCDADEAGSMCSTGMFRYPGPHFYEVRVYDCEQIQSALGVPCGAKMNHSLLNQSLLSELQPLCHGKVTFNVTGEYIAPQCILNSDCNQTCENCSRGLYHCFMRRCVECSANAYCKKGYLCNMSEFRCEEKISCEDLGGVVCPPGEEGGCGCMGGNILYEAKERCCCKFYSENGSCLK
ncbi:hypothetical protein H0N99_03205 [Candidatus Micrarchaeota archaeon]|nr:hypothetical protein [Candidatus Micrarchaeota archaeon]